VLRQDLAGPAPEDRHALDAVVAAMRQYEVRMGILKTYNSKVPPGSVSFICSGCSN
jgi:hypothetical protein